MVVPKSRRKTSIAVTNLILSGVKYPRGLGEEAAHRMMTGKTRWDLGTMINREALKAARKAKGWNQTELAQRVSATQQFISQLENDPTVRYTPLVFKLAEVLCIEPYTLDDSIPPGLSTVDAIQIVGYVGSGNEVTFYSSEGPSAVQLALAPNLPVGPGERTAALEVRTEGLGSFFNGWICYYSDVHLPPEVTADLYVIRLTDGRTFVNKLVPGSKPDRFHLLNQSGGILQDVEIAWVARVLAIVPPVGK
jgi:transcriptional regulator with XRE-family HTH domain